MTTQPTPPKKARKPRRKQWASEIARQQHSKHRRNLARQQADREAARIAGARSDLANAEQRLANAEHNRRSNLVAAGLTPRLIAVMHSYGINVPVNISGAAVVSAYTDFEKIVVKHDQRLNLAKTVGSEDLRQIAAETRGLFYHEVGHLLYTLPLPYLTRMAWDTGYDFDPAHVSALAEATKPRLDYTGERVPFTIFPVFHKAWNAMEDQRMEGALVEDSPQIAAYLTVLVLRQIVSDRLSWALIANRWYLPDAVRKASKAAWDQAFALGQVNAESDTVAAVVDAYCNSTDPVAMVECIAAMASILQGNGRTVDNHDPGTTRTNGEVPGEDSREQITSVGEKNRDRQASQPEQSDKDVPGDGQSKDDAKPGEGSEGENSDDADPEDESDGRGDSTRSDRSSDNPGEPSGDPGVGQGEPGEPSYGDAVRDALEQAEDILADDQTLADDVAAMNEAYNNDEGGLPVYDHVRPLDDAEIVSQATGIVGDLVRAFEIATVDCAPRWESGQRRGILEPIRYKTRQPGDLEFFRQYADDGEPGVDLAVSLILDVSGSMEGASDVLGATAWAVKTACQQISVDCDVSVFHTYGYKVWGVDDTVEEPVSLGTTGGTQPRSAFEGVLSKARPKKHHIVLIMTDGEWPTQDQGCFKEFRHENTYAAVFFYTDPDSRWGTPVECLTPDPSLALRLLVDEAYQISDLLDIPQALERLIVSMV